jgi:hypothetical protein
MSRTTTTIRTALALAATIAAVLTCAVSASADGGPILVSPGGCALQCIQKALVTVTSTAARVDFRTSVPTRISVTARRLSTTGGLVTAPDASAAGHTLKTERMLFLLGLRSKTTYRIVVYATDAQGHVASRTGTFATLAVAAAIETGGTGGFSSGLGCSVQCIQKAVPVGIGPTAAVFEVKTYTPARIRVLVGRDPAVQQVVGSSQSAGLTTAFTAGANPLDPGTRYYVSIQATDASGRTATAWGSFKTVERHVRVTLWKVKVISDGDKGRARGEMYFDYWAGGRWLGGENGFHKRSSGDTFTVRAQGTSRPGLTFLLPANGRDPKLDIRAYAEECDGPARMKNCALESHPGAPSGGGDLGDDDTATAGGLFSMSDLLTAGALPPNFGMDMPTGHIGYFAFETTQYHVKFRVYAFADVVFGEV